MKEYPLVVDAFLQLKPEYQKVIEQITREMGEGMAEFIPKEVGSDHIERKRDFFTCHVKKFHSKALLYTPTPCTTLHCPALHSNALHYTPMPCITLQCPTLHSNALHYTPMPCTTLQCPALSIGTLLISSTPMVSDGAYFIKICIPAES
jgi:hypothetical protein